MSTERLRELLARLEPSDSRLRAALELAAGYVPATDLARLVKKHGIDTEQLYAEVRAQVADAELRAVIAANKRRRAGSKKPRLARLPFRDALSQELAALVTTMARADAVAALARKYNVEPPAVNARLRRAPK